MNKEESKLVTLLDTSLIHEVQIAKTLLASCKIPSYIFDENLSSIGLATIEGYKLKVSNLDYDKAKQILNNENTIE